MCNKDKIVLNHDYNTKLHVVSLATLNVNVFY